MVSALALWEQFCLSPKKAFFKSPQSAFELLSITIISLRFGNVEKQNVS